MEDELAARATLDVADLLDLYRRDVPILRQTRGHGCERPPPVRSHGRDRDRRAVDNQVRLPDVPLVGGCKDQQRRRVCRVPLRRTAVHPHGDRVDLFLAQRDVIPKALDTDILLDEPGRHDPHAIAKPGPLFDTAGPRSYLFVGDQRHRRDRAGSMAALATALKNRRDVLRERRLASRLPGQHKRRHRKRDETDQRNRQHPPAHRHPRRASIRCHQLHPLSN